jgi:RNA polymerase sigma-70 factor, ECF subfamily
VSGEAPETDLDHLYRTYGTMVFRRARRLLGDEQQARDACHDVFVQVLRTRGWNPPSPVGWFYTTTTNWCLNQLRSARRGRGFLRKNPPVPPPATGLPVGALLHGLPADLQEVAVYYAIDGMSQDEIAQVLNVSQKTVSNRIRELRAHLGDVDPGRALEAT